MSKQTTNLIIIFITIIIIVLLGYFFVMPSYSKMTTAKQEFQNQETTYLQNKKQIEEIKNNEKYYQEIIKNSAKTDELIPSQKDIDNFIIQLEEIAKRSNVGLKTVEITTPTPESSKKPATEGTNSTQGQSQGQTQTQTKSTTSVKSSLTQVAKNGNFYTIAFKLSITGSYASTLDYLSLMEHINRFVTIKKVSIKLSGTNILDVSIDGIIYIKP